jgi:hypothetical protein
MEPEYGPLKIELHEEAKALVRQYVMEFGASLVLQAKQLAARNEAEVVLKKDVRQARDAITKGRAQPAWMGQFASIFGGVFLGNFVRSLWTDIPAGHSLAIAGNAMLAILGMILIFYGLTK